jgi:uncharacterized phage protein gp47/JayE
VNPETATLIERPYHEIVDDLLTALVGGVVNEPVVFDVKSDLYPLSQLASAVRGVTGTVDGAPYTFQQLIDYVFSEGDGAVVWQAGGKRPDDDTTFYVDYFRPDSRSRLTDINVGSVTRTLAEAIGREIATVYQEINQAYLGGFVDTAEGTSLELVVSILGVVRKTKDFAQGLVTFFRDPTQTGTVTIPEGTRLATTDGKAEFETTEPRTMQRAQARVDVPVRATEAFKGEPGKVAAGTITEVAEAIQGIARVTNIDPTVLGADDESDADLRRRAKGVLRSLSKGTQAALQRVVFEERSEVLEVWDPNAPPGKQTDPGSVALLVEAEPRRFESLVPALHEVRAAGVSMAVVARYVYLKLRVTGTVDAGLTPAGKDKVVQEAIDAIRGYVDGLGSGDPAQGQQLLAALAVVTDLHDPRIVDVIPSRSDVAKPAVETLLDALIEAVAPLPPGDTGAVRAALSGILAASAPVAPSGTRVFDRDLVQGPSGQRATDQEIEAGTFTVLAQVQGDPWWIVLDMEEADVALAAGGP